MDVTYLDPRINLGSVFFLQENFPQAVRAFRNAADAMLLARDVDSELALMVYINLSKAHFELGEYEAAEASFAQATQANPDNAEQFGYLAQAGSQGARASDAASGPPILFADVTGEEE